MSSASELAQKTIEAFKTHFNAEPMAVAFAPGRVNVIGEHTDYNNGFVMPIALELGTVAAGRIQKTTLPQDSSFDELTINLATSTGKAIKGSEPSHVSVSFKHQALLPGQWSPAMGPLPSPLWANYMLGSVAAYSNELLQLCSSKNTHVTLDILVDSSVPLGAGLSSSAAVEVSVYYLMHALLDLPGQHPAVEKAAKACQQVEHKFAGIPCGIMDQFVSAGGRQNAAMLIDCRDLTYKHVPLPSAKEAMFVIADTGVSHSLATSEYSVRAQQCKAAAKRLNVPSLREQEHWDEKFINDESDIEMRRARHVINENERCSKAAVLMAQPAGEATLKALGELMTASHRSLQHDYEVSCKELDRLVDTALTIPGVFGSRMTGGGFGGSTVTLVAPGSVDELVKALVAAGAVRTLVVSAADGARVLFNSAKTSASQTA